MKINLMRFLLLVIFICICCTGSAYASDVVGLDISFSPEPPFLPGEQVVLTVSVGPAQPGAFVELQSEFGGFFASGYTDDNGKFTAVYTVPDNALELVESSSQPGSICITAICQPPQNNQWAQSLDYYCKIASPSPVGISQSFSPQPPFFPGEQVAVTATVEPVQSGVHVQLQSELGGYFADGYTDNNGEFTGVYTVPDNALEWVKSSATGGIRFAAYCPEAGVQSMDVSCEIIPEPVDAPIALDFPSFNPQPPFWPGEHVDVTTTIYPPQAGAYVKLQSELGGYFAEGYTDSDGKLTGTYIVPDNALEWVKSSPTGGIRFSAYCPEGAIQSGDISCEIIPEPVSTVMSISMPSFNPQPPFWPGEHVDVTATVYPAQSRIHVQLQSELGGYFAEGYTDNNGKFTGTYTVPDNALEWVKSSDSGGIRFSANCPDESIPYSGDISCKVVPEPAEDPQIPEFPSIAVPVVAVLGMIAIVGRRKM